MIKRYDDVAHDAYAEYDMEEAKDGQWVKYEDHERKLNNAVNDRQAVIDSKDMELEKMKETYKGLMGELCKVTTCRLEPLIMMARGPGKSETVARIFNELLEEIEKS